MDRYGSDGDIRARKFFGRSETEEKREREGRERAKVIAAKKLRLFSTHFLLHDTRPHAPYGFHNGRSCVCDEARGDLQVRGGQTNLLSAVAIRVSPFQE